MAEHQKSSRKQHRAKIGVAGFPLYLFNAELLDKNINSAYVPELDALEKDLESFKQAGNPNPKPVHPPKLARKTATPEQVAEREEAMKVYHKKMAEHAAYKSPEFVNVAMQVKLKHKLVRLAALLSKKERKEPDNLVVTKLQQLLRGEAKYSKIANDNFNHEGFMKFCVAEVNKGKTDVTNIESVLSLANSYSGELFSKVEKFQELHKKCKKIDKEARHGVTTLIETAMRELISKTVNNCYARYAKTPEEMSYKVTPDDIITADNDGWLKVTKTLHTYQLVLNRFNRRQEYEARSRESYLELLKSKAAEASANGESGRFKRPVDNTVPFEVTEVANGKCVSKTHVTASKKPEGKTRESVKYYWFGIDDVQKADKTENGTSKYPEHPGYTFYTVVSHLFENIIESVHSSRGDSYINISVGSSTKLVIGAMIVELMSTLSEAIRSVFALTGEPVTINWKIVSNAVKIRFGSVDPKVLSKWEEKANKLIAEEKKRADDRKKPNGLVAENGKAEEKPKDTTEVASGKKDLKKK